MCDMSRERRMPHVKCTKTFLKKHQSTFNNNNEKCEAIKRAVSGYKNQVAFFCGITGTKPKATECSFKIAH